ncbi:hypothetical protein VTL71DRAFT_791 [Oculimacula yallundae]|uniref:2EXR domain-containing protein n=1 Tax=Oculimacula yallundae TaxID=86028 RepID=A0ABR4D2J1_9HELO
MSSSPIMASADSNSTTPPEGIMADTSKIDAHPSAIPNGQTSDGASTMLLTMSELVLHTLSSTRLETFPIFPNLPLEIRRLIWQKTLPPTARVHIMNYSGFSKIFPTQTLNDFKNLNKHYANPLPAALHVNQESRIEVLQTYALLPSSLTLSNIAPSFFISATDRIVLFTGAALNFDQNLNWKEDCCLSQLGKESFARYISRARFLRLDSFCVPWSNMTRAKILSRHTDEQHTATPDTEPFCCMFKHFPALNGVFVSVDSPEDDAYLSAGKGCRQLKILRQVLKYHRHEFAAGGLVPQMILIYKEPSKAYSFHEWYAMKRAEKLAKIASRNRVVAS